MNGVVLAAGLGTRLAPLTRELAKPAVPLFDVPLVVHAMTSVVAAGVRKLAVNVHHLPATVIEAAEGAMVLPAMRDVKLVFSREDEILGTAGGVRRAVERLGDDNTLVFNSDIRLDREEDLVELLSAHQRFARDHRKHRATLLLAEKVGGPVGMLARTPPVITRLRHEGTSDTDFDLSGSYVLTRAAVGELAERGDIVSENFTCWLDGRVRGRLGSGFADLGTLDNYLRAHLHALPRFANHGCSRVGQGVRLERSSVTRSWVGHGATLVNATLRECVVWPGAYVSGAHERAVITSTQIVNVASS